MSDLLENRDGLIISLRTALIKGSVHICCGILGICVEHSPEKNKAQECLYWSMDVTAHGESARGREGMFLQASLTFLTFLSSRLSQ